MQSKSITRDLPQFDSHMKMIHGERCCLGYRSYCQGNAWEQKSEKSAKSLSYIISSKAHTSHRLNIAAGYQHLAYQALFPCKSHSFLGGWVNCSFMKYRFGLSLRTKGVFDLIFDLINENVRTLLNDGAQFCPRCRRQCAGRDEASRHHYKLLHMKDRLRYTVFNLRFYESSCQ